MSIASAITTKQQQVADCYTSVSNKKGTLPDVQNLTNLSEAINSIPTDSGGSSVLAHNSLNRPLTQDEKVLLRYDIGSGYKWTIVENSAQNYDSVLAFTGVWANGGAYDPETKESYEIVKTVLPPSVNVVCTLDMGETNYVPEISIV